MTMNLLKALYCDATFRPDDIAFIQQDDIWTCKRLTSEVNRLAHGFLARGLGRGDRVVLHMRNVPELVVAYFACFSIGAIAAPLNPRLKTPEIENVLKRLKPLLYIGQDDLYQSSVAEISASLLPAHARCVVGLRHEGVMHPWSQLLSQSSDAAELPEPSLDEPAVLLATSGTTGKPKFVTHTLATISAAAELCGNIALSGDDIAIIATPMAHANGFFLFFSCIWHGAQIILHEHFDADTVVDSIERHRATWFGGLPFMFAEVLASQKNLVRDVTSLKACVVVGDVCAPRIQQQFESHFGTPLLSLWSATETIGSLTFGSKAAPISRAAPGAEVRLCDRNGMPVRPGEAGELQVRGPNVTVGYWEAPGIIMNATDDGWYHTGDLMRQDENGELWFISRMKDMIIRGGSSISPAEVEFALASHPAVKDVAVAGVPDDLFGQRVIGFVELSRDAREMRIDDILANARRLIADYKLPERLEVISRIPRNALGKIDRGALLNSLPRRRETAA